MSFKTITGSKILLMIDPDPAGGLGTATAIAGATSATINFAMDSIDCTNKYSSGRKEFIAGASSWTLDCEAFASGDGSTNANADIMSALDDKDKIYVKFRDDSGQGSSKMYTGRGYITACNQTASVGEFSTYSLTIQGTGQLTQASA